MIVYSTSIVEANEIVHIISDIDVLVIILGNFSDFVALSLVPSAV